MSLRRRYRQERSEARPAVDDGTITGEQGLCMEVRGLNAWYGQAQALRNVSLTVKPGEILGVLGRNGAGKSTLLRCLARLHRRASGRIYLHGSDIISLPADQVASKGVGLVREGAIVYESLTVDEHLQLAQVLALRRGAIVDPNQVAEWFPMIWERRNEQGGYLSGGQRQMLALAMGFLAQPACLLLDEPSAGLAESVAASVYASIAKISVERQMALVIAEQDARWLSGFASRAYVLDNGVNSEEMDAHQLEDVDVGWLT